MTSSQPLNIKVILGSTRPGRFSEKPAQWILNELKQIAGVNATMLDLRDYPLPFFDAPAGPFYLNGNYPHEIVKKWSAAVADADGFVIIAPEYNHGPSAVLKNALDWLGPEWTYKPVAFVGYGSAGGARAIEHLRGVIAELKMVTVKDAVHILWADMMKINEAPQPSAATLYAGYAHKKDAMIADLLTLAKALKATRSPT